MVEVYGKEITESSLIPNFQTLLKDDENEVKIAAISSLSQFIKSLSVEKIGNLIPPIQALAKDQNDQVRGIVFQFHLKIFLVFIKIKL